MATTTSFPHPRLSKSSSPSSFRQKCPADMKRTATIVLAGGKGTRLFPLTTSRCKPALCYGGRYRLIDIPISNAIHSGSKKIFVIAQFLSNSLHHHISSIYRSESVDLLLAEEKPKGKVWFQGTADAVRQNLDYLEEAAADYFFILSGDQLYYMDLCDMLQRALESGADLTIACLPICENDAKRMGVLQLDANNLVTAFQEKPQTRQDLDQLRLSSQDQSNLDISDHLQHLGSMGIYLFKRQALIDLLTKDSREDFGRHLIPGHVAEGKVAAYIHRGYWEDIGTVESFHKANLLLTQRNAPFNCYDEKWSVFASPATLPGSRIYGTHVESSILCEGTVVEAVEVSNSIIGPRASIQKGAVIRNTYVMGHDFFTPSSSHSRLPQTFEIGKNSVICNAIIDKQTYIGKNVQLINKEKLSHFDSENLYIRDGIIVVPYGAAIPDGFIL